MSYRFTFTYEGTVYKFGSLKVREIETLEDLLSTPEKPVRYVELSPFTTMRHKLAIMAVFLRRDHDEAEVASIIDGLDLDAVQAMWDVEVDDLPTEFEDGVPLTDAATSTPTS